MRLDRRFAASRRPARSQRTRTVCHRLPRCPSTRNPAARAAAARGSIGRAASKPRAERHDGLTGGGQPPAATEAAGARDAGGRRLAARGGRASCTPHSRPASAGESAAAAGRGCGRDARARFSGRGHIESCPRAWAAAAAVAVAPIWLRGAGGSSGVRVGGVGGVVAGSPGHGRTRAPRIHPTRSTGTTLWPRGLGRTAAAAAAVPPCWSWMHARHDSRFFCARHPGRPPRSPGHTQWATTGAGPAALAGQWCSTRLGSHGPHVGLTIARSAHAGPHAVVQLGPRVWPSSGARHRRRVSGQPGRR